MAILGLAQLCVKYNGAGAFLARLLSLRHRGAAARHRSRDDHGHAAEAAAIPAKPSTGRLQIDQRRHTHTSADVMWCWRQRTNPLGFHAIPMIGLPRRASSGINPLLS
jgi:hypothetical protein